MNAILVSWCQLLTVLATEICLVVVGVTLSSHWTRSAQQRRSLWQAGLSAVALIVVVESAGLRGLLFGLLSATGSATERRLTAVVRPLAENQPLPARDTEELSTVPGDASITDPPQMQTAVAWPGYVWLLGTGLLASRALASRCWLARQRRRTKSGDAHAVETAVRLGRLLGVGYVDVRVWPHLRGPVAFGTWRPTIALPTDFAERFTPAQCEAMLVHELAHLAGRDPLWLAVADLVCALAWWHPGVWWARHQLRAASESAADEASAIIPDGGVALAESLLAMGRELAATGPYRSLGIAGSGFRSELGGRVAALLRTSPSWSPLAARQRWRLRCAVLAFGMTLSALPWPGSGGPSALTMLAQAARAPDLGTDALPPSAKSGRTLPGLRNGRLAVLNLDAQPSGANVALPETTRQDPNEGNLPPLGDAAGSLNASKPLASTASSPVSGSKVEPTPPGLAVNPLIGTSEKGLDETTVKQGLVTRKYTLRDPAKFLLAIRQTEGVTPSTNSTADISQFLNLCGLDFREFPRDVAAAPLTDRIFFNDHAGTLFVRAHAGMVQNLDAVLDALDTEPLEADGPLVTLKVSLAEVTLAGTPDLGLDWLFGLSPTNNPVTETTRPNPKAGTRVDTLTSKGEWAALKAPQFDALRRSLESRDGVDFLSAPEVTTRSGRQAQVVVQNVRTIVTAVNASVDSHAQAVGFDQVFVSATNTQPGINYVTESISTGPTVDITPQAENEGWRLTTAARVTEFMGYDDPGKGNEPYVQALGAKPLKATRPLARLLVREMLAEAFVMPGETLVLRGARVSRTHVFRSGVWPMRRSQTNVVQQRLYAFITPEVVSSPAAVNAASAPAVQPLVVRVSSGEPDLRVGNRLLKEGDVLAALKAEHDAKPNLKLLLTTDSDASYARLRTVLEFARQAGIQNVFLRQ